VVIPLVECHGFVHLVCPEEVRRKTQEIIGQRGEGAELMLVS
jgi:hypothetical protein